ncbi:hypothetical protein AWB81_03056 [Caballeronia arationis]|uniref:Uncharacterized protein n=1 Tax=Caballeronia arationis TaxID=1777142 RepID=A0A7Z7IA51_9BURK|nr:hypothetical protein AWB81_03056 [Caballeronia arationis]SOE82139.1 hypothetical protein SAMN05446927_5451 [Caballeronia arationis]
MLAVACAFSSDYLAEKRVFRQFLLTSPQGTEASLRTSNRYLSISVRASLESVAAAAPLAP